MKPSLVIFGLGNPGAAYQHTRHNAGFRALDVLSDAFGQGAWEEKQKFLSVTQEARIVTVPVFLIKPQTYMNRSGESVRKVVDFYKLHAAEQILILCDDVDLPLGGLRLRKTGGPGTHNGLRSIAQSFGEAYPRLRIGLGAPPAGADLATWVLSVPSAEEDGKLHEAFARIPAMVKDYILGELPKEK